MTIADPMPATMAQDDREEISREIALQRWLSEASQDWLADPNIWGIGIGHRRTKGEWADELSIVFSVAEKSSNLAKLKTRKIPKTIKFAGHRFKTDVVCRVFEPESISQYVVTPEERRMKGVDIRPGMAVASDAGVGTITAIVRMRNQMTPLLLTNQHVLSGKGQRIFQPPPLTGKDETTNIIGSCLEITRLVQTDAAICDVGQRKVWQNIIGFDKPITSIRRAALNDRVVKSGLATGVTYGIVRTPDGKVPMRYPFLGTRQIDGFVIEPDGSRPSDTGGISGKMDSGSPWMLADADGKPTGELVGIHVGGTPDTFTLNSALACHADQVFAQLGIELFPATADAVVAPLGTALLLGVAVAPERHDPFVVNVKTTLALRPVPFRDSTVLRWLPAKTLLFVIGIFGDWAKVDLQGDGSADGYVWRDYLSPAQQP